MTIIPKDPSHVETLLPAQPESYVQISQPLPNRENDQISRTMSQLELPHPDSLENKYMTFSPKLKKFELNQQVQLPISLRAIRSETKFTCVYCNTKFHNKNTLEIHEK